MSIQTINAEILQGAFTNEQLDSIQDAVKFARSRIAQKNIFTFRTGANVQFTSNRNGQTYKGVVEKVGRKYIVVRTAVGGYRVPANMLTSV
jgi:phosphoribosylaminoimidazole carboxylase (NCAIR synthetase)